jgi:hypothetical protein
LREWRRTRLEHSLAAALTRTTRWRWRASSLEESCGRAAYEQLPGTSLHEPSRSDQGVCTAVGLADWTACVHACMHACCCCWKTRTVARTSGGRPTWDASGCVPGQQGRTAEMSAYQSSSKTVEPELLPACPRVCLLYKSVRSTRGAQCPQ